MKWLIGLKTWIALGAAGGSAPLIARFVASHYGLTEAEAMWLVAAIPTAVGAVMRTVSSAPFLGGIRTAFAAWRQRRKRRLTPEEITAIANLVIRHLEKMKP